MNLTGIKNIIFDLGNVLLNIDGEKTLDAFRKFGVDRFDDIYTLQQQSIIIDLLETGKMTQLEFVNQIREFFEQYISEDDILDAWNAMILDFPEDRINLVKQLGEKYSVFLLSNTNEIHYAFFKRKFKRQYKMRFKELFTKAFLSHEIGMRKPNKRIFEYISKGAIIDPEQTLFIDDDQENIKSAQQLGFKTYWLKKDEEIVELFKDNI